MTPRGLGRGLSALIPGAPAPISRDRSGALVALDDIVPNPHQPRRSFDPEELAALTASIRTHGILQPLVVSARSDGTYELIAGERRLRAARLAGMSAVPVVIRDGEPDDRTKLELALIENVQREDLNPIDRAEAFRQLQEQFGLTQEEVAVRVGISRSAVAHTLRLLVLPEDMRHAVRDHVIAEGHAKVLAGIADPAEQRAWFERIRTQQLPVATVAAAIRPSATSPQGGDRRRSSMPLDPNLRAKALALQQRLGARVRITPQGLGGRITIEYADAEELAGILRAMLR